MNERLLLRRDFLSIIHSLSHTTQVMQLSEEAGKSSISLSHAQRLKKRRNVPEVWEILLLHLLLLLHRDDWEEQEERR